MRDQVTVCVKADGGESGGPDSRFAKLDSATRRSANRNLSQVAFVYASAYLAAFLYYWVLLIQEAGAFRLPRPVDLVVAVGSIAYALFVGLRCRSGRCGAQAFTRTAETFLVVGALGISGSMWGWEAEAGSRAPHVEGVPWLAVWLLTFPNIVTLTPRRFLVGTVLGVLSLPAVLFASVIVHGLPAAASAGVLEFTVPLAVRLLVPTVICAGVAVYCSRRAFRMVEDVSEARRMGSYQLTEKIGAGGMGEVWKAEHHMLIRPAAIKLIRREALGGRSESSYRTLVARFEREVQATAALTSPHTVQIYDFGMTDGSFYCVMELLEGLDLKSLVEKHGPIPAARVVHFLRQACESLADAHESGLIHRDVKPANLFTCRVGRTHDFVKVLDFGLVKETAVPEDERTQLTMEGVVSGTPAFMAPETASSMEGIDGRADLYALGCVGYWLLTGQLVFTASTPVTMLVQHATEKPVPPSHRSELAIPGSLDRLILQCLEKSPRDRPGSARELAARLEEVQRDCGEWTQERAEHWWRAHLPALAAAPLVAAEPWVVATR